MSRNQYFTLIFLNFVILGNVVKKDEFIGGMILIIIGSIGLLACMIEPFIIN